MCTLFGINYLNTNMSRYLKAGTFFDISICGALVFPQLCYFLLMRPDRMKAYRTETLKTHQLQIKWLYRKLA